MRLSLPSGLFSLSKGTIFARYLDKLGADGLDRYIFDLRVDGNNSISGRKLAGNGLNVSVRASGTSQASLNSTANVVAGNVYSLALAYELDNVGAAFSIGTQPPSDVSATMPTGAFVANLGNDGSGSSANFLGTYLQRFTYVPFRKSQDDIYNVVLYGGY